MTSTTAPEPTIGELIRKHADAKAALKDSARVFAGAQLNTAAEREAKHDLDRDSLAFALIDRELKSAYREMELR